MDVLIIENVGNLVCPAEFKVGEDARVMVYAITEGEERPLKYLLMFRPADLVLVNRVDLLPHPHFDLGGFLRTPPGRREPRRRAHPPERRHGRGRRRVVLAAYREGGRLMDPAL